LLRKRCHARRPGLRPGGDAGIAAAGGSALTTDEEFMVNRKT